MLFVVFVRKDKNIIISCLPIVVLSSMRLSPESLFIITKVMILLFMQKMMNQRVLPVRRVGRR